MVAVPLLVIAATSADVGAATAQFAAFVNSPVPVLFQYRVAA
jgi:hypothetical protein